MPFTLCPRHGGQPGSLICGHLYQAVLNRRVLPEIFHVEAWFLGALAGERFLCPDCAASNSIEQPTTIWGDDDGLDRLFAITGDIQPLCSACFREARDRLM